MRLSLIARYRSHYVKHSHARTVCGGKRPRRRQSCQLRRARTTRRKARKRVSTKQIAKRRVSAARCSSPSSCQRRALTSPKCMLCERPHPRDCKRLSTAAAKSALYALYDYPANHACSRLNRLKPTLKRSCEQPVNSPISSQKVRPFAILKSRGMYSSSIL